MIDLNAPFVGIDGTEPGITLKEMFRRVAIADPVFEAGQNAGQARPLTAKEIGDRMMLYRKLEGDTLVLSVAEKMAVQDMLRFIRPAFAVPLNDLLEERG